MSKLRLSDVCHGLYVECGPRKKVVEGWFNWHVDILVDGTLTQSGVLIEDSWVLVKRTSIKYAPKGHDVIKIFHLHLESYIKVI